MSYFNGYRINFAGGFYTNVDTANNDDVISAGTDPVAAMMLPPYDKMPDDKVRAKFMKPSSSGKLNAGWNYMGDYETRFINAKVTSCGLPGQVVNQGPALLGTPVYLLGHNGKGAPVMVDVDPTGGGVATQIFVGGLQLGDGDTALRILHDTVCYTYFMGNRFDPNTPNPQGFNGFASAGVWFQFAIPKTSLPASATVSDPALKQLLEAAGTAAAQGLVVRFAPFEATPSMTPSALAALFAQNQAEVNPCIGYVIGTIGIWGEGEMATSPPGRVLSDTTHMGPNGPVYSVALAHADPATGLLSLDLVQAIWKAGFRASATDVSAIGPNKDVGPLSVRAASSPQPIAVFTPDPNNYWQFGGLVDLQIGSGAAQGLIGLQITLTDALGTMIWVEEAYRVESEQRGVYLDLGDPSPNRHAANLQLRITEYGRAPTLPVVLIFTTQCSGAATYPNAENYGNITFINGGPLPATTLVVSPPGTTSLLVGVNGQPCLSQVSVQAIGPFGQSNNGTFQSIFLVSPIDDFSAVIAAGNIPWSLVYENVLRYYYLIFPAMSERLPLNKRDVLTIPPVAQQIKDRMDDKLFMTTKYMPITRNLSYGKKKLLFAFLDQEVAKQSQPIASGIATGPTVPR